MKGQLVLALHVLVIAKHYTFQSIWINPSDKLRAKTEPLGKYRIDPILH